MLLNSINESLEKKYTESYELDEKFSDSIPDWLGKRILTTKYARRRSARSGNSNQRAGLVKGNLNDKNPGEGPSPTYINPRGEYSNDDSLFGKFLEKGVNLDSVQVIEGEKPEKRTDARLKEPNIPIFLFKNGQVYAKGINDNEEYAGNGEYRAFKYLPMKTLLSDEVEKFAYIDGNNDNNFKATETRIERGKTQAELNKLPNYFRNKQRAGQNLDRRRSWQDIYDKSGYLIDPSRYKAQLAELKCNRIYDLLDEKYNILEQAKEGIADVLMSVDLKDSENSDYSKVFTDYNNFFDLFKNAVESYKLCVKNIDTILNDENRSDKEKREMLLNFINYDGNYDTFMTTIKEIEKQSPKLFNSIIDWI